MYNFLFWPVWTISTSFKMHKSKKDFFSFYKSWEAHLRMCNHPQGSQERKRPSALLAWVATWNRISWWLTSGRLLLLWQNTNTRKSVCNTNITKPFEGKSGQLSVVLLLCWNIVAWSPFGRLAPCVKKFWLASLIFFTSAFSLVSSCTVTLGTKRSYFQNTEENCCGANLVFSLFVRLKALLCRVSPPIPPSALLCPLFVLFFCQCQCWLVGHFAAAFGLTSLYSAAWRKSIIIKHSSYMWYVGWVAPWMKCCNYLHKPATSWKGQHSIKCVHGYLSTAPPSPLLFAKFSLKSFFLCHRVKTL